MELSRENPIGRFLQNYSNAISDEEKRRRIEERKNRNLQSFSGSDAPINPERLPAFNFDKTTDIPQTKNITPKKLSTLDTGIQYGPENLPTPFLPSLASSQVNDNKKSGILLTNKGAGNENGRVIGDINSFDKPDTVPQTIGRGATFEERGFSRSLPTINKAITNPATNSSQRALFTRDNSNMGWQARLALNKQILENEGGVDQQNIRNLGALEAQRINNEGNLAVQGLENEILSEKQIDLQNKAKAKNLQDMRDANKQRIKAKYDFLKGQQDLRLGDPLYDAELKKAATEYERLLNTGTTGDANELAQKYL